MSELERIFYGLATSKDSASNIPCLDFDDFKSALTEVFKLVEVTDEEIKTDSWDSFPELSMQDGTNRFSFSLGAKSTRSVSKTKLEKLIG